MCNYVAPPSPVRGDIDGHCRLDRRHLLQLDGQRPSDGRTSCHRSRAGRRRAQLKNYLDALGGLWSQGRLSDKVYAGFTSTGTKRGGQESTLLALYNSVYHFGGLLVPPGYTDPAVKFNDGNPYGVSHFSGNGTIALGEEELAALDHLATRAVTTARALIAGRTA